MTDEESNAVENGKTLRLVGDLAKQADLAMSAGSVPDRLRYFQQIWHTAEDLVNHAAAVAESLAGGCVR